MDKEYRDVCNVATLQSDRRGFFLELAEAAEEVAGDQWVAAFKELPSHRERITACLNDPKVCDIVHSILLKIQQIFRGKASKFAKAKMEEGEHWLKKGKLQKALASTNLAVVRAPVKDTNVNEDMTIAPLSLWLRSEILFTLSEYRNALNDIQLALKYQLPSSLKADAYKRMGLCYIQLGDKKKATVSLNVACSCGNRELQEECKRILSDSDIHLNLTPEKKGHSVDVNSLPGMPGINSSLKIQEDPDHGRHFKAAIPISIGEVVASEEPYASVLYIEKHGTHCLQCFLRLKAPVPCPSCSGVAFCSNECLEKGLKYHKWECPYLELQIGSGMSLLSHLSLRMITQNDLEYFKNMKSTNHLHHKVLHLEGHVKERDGKDLFRRTLMALFLLQMLRLRGYFKGKAKNGPLNGKDPFEERIGELTEDEMAIGCLLLGHLIVLQYNAHEVYETVIVKKNGNNPGQTNYIGLAVYIYSSFFNHQCQPALARYFSGRKIILRAQHPINIDEEVTENYGPVFTMRTKEQRQNLLWGRYLFKCTCPPCSFDWPKLENLKPETAYFRCKQSNCSGAVPETGICQVCGNKQSLREDQLLFYSYQKDWEKAAELFKIGKYKEAEETAIHYIYSMWKIVRQPSKNLSLAMELLRTIWANTSGNVSILDV